MEEAAATDDCTQSACGLKQLGRLVFNHLHVTDLIDFRVTHVQKLLYLALRDGVGRSCQQRHDAHRIEIYHHLEAA